MVSMALDSSPLFSFGIRVLAKSIAVRMAPSAALSPASYFIPEVFTPMALPRWRGSMLFGSTRLKATNSTYSVVVLWSVRFLRYSIASSSDH